MKRLIAALLVLAFAAACSDDGGGGERPTEGAEADLADAVEGYFDAFTSGDPAATRLFISARCNAVLVDPDFTNLVTATVEAYPDLAIESWESVEIDGDTATVEYETGEEVVDAAGPSEWVNEDGWKYDNC
jgi:hypothetical protein